LFGVFFFLTGLFAPTLTQVLNEVNQNLLAVFSTYYLWIGLISVIAALLFYVCLYANSV
jgi:glycine betaine transporter